MKVKVTFRDAGLEFEIPAPILQLMLSQAILMILTTAT